MHDYLFPTEVIRFAFVAGVVVSMLLYERYHLTTGSIVVPGYVALFLVMPFVIVATIINATASYWLVNRVLPRWFLLYGRTKFTALAAVSIVIQAVMLKLSPSGPWWWETDVPLFVGVGYVVPALIAHDMARQGIQKTARSVALASVLVALPIALAVLFHAPGLDAKMDLGQLGHTRLDPSWVPLAVLLSAAAAWGVATNYRLRAGGFVGAALVAVFAVNPWQVALIAAAALLTYWLVTKVLMGRMILFGRRKFAAMLLISSAMIWTLLALGEQLLPTDAQRHLGVMSLALTPLFLPGLMANDMHRSSPLRVMLGVPLASTFVLLTTQSVEALVEGRRPPLTTAGVAFVTFALIFLPQLRSALGALAPYLAKPSRPLSGFGRAAGACLASLDAAAERGARLLSTGAGPAAGIHLAKVPAISAWGEVTVVHHAAPRTRRRYLPAEHHGRPARRPEPGRYRPQHLAVGGDRKVNERGLSHPPARTAR